GRGQPPPPPLRPKAAARALTFRYIKSIPAEPDPPRRAKMSPPTGFSWIEKPQLAALARPDGVEDLQWLRGQGIDLLVSLTEDPPYTRWVNDAGLLLMHVPMADMEAPSQDQLDRCISA